MDSVDVLLVSCQTPPPLTPNKRRITPTAEHSASKRCLVLSPRGLVPEGPTISLAAFPEFQHSERRFPSGEAKVESTVPVKLPHAHPEPESPRLGDQGAAVTSISCRHVILPFNLRKDPKAFGNPAYDGLLNNLFPDTMAVWFDGHFLVFHMRTLPPRPYPRTVAGVQPYFTTDRNDTGPVAPLFKRRGALQIKVREDVDCREDIAKMDFLFNLIRQHFEAAKIAITEMQLWGNFLVIVLEDYDTDLKLVPSSIAKCPCYYVFEKEMSRPSNLAARRQKEPTGATRDDSTYKTLRPGVMLSSGKPPAPGVSEYLTTSGVMVVNSLDNKFLTVTSHGFPHGTNVYHPVAGGREVGTIIMELSHTDVALVRLHDNVEYVNECFENTLGENSPVRLVGFERHDKTTIGSAVYMNNAFSGYDEGTYGPHGEMRVPSDDPNEPTQIWISTRWAYLGQGASEHMVDGVCGSALWNEYGKVVGFFRYAATEGIFADWCLTVASDHLIDAGYSLAYWTP